jgi:HPr kinase/phosphorylase
VTQALVHATAVAIDGLGILLVGPSGSGKSDLALRMIDRGGILVSDDVVIVSRHAMDLFVGVAPNIEGRIEIRGVGICSVPHLMSAPLKIVIALSSDVERMPDDNRMENMLGVDVPYLTLAPFEASAPIKVEMALRRIVDVESVSVPVGSLPLRESQKI